MRNNITDYLGIADNIEIESPIAIYARLPEVLRFVTLLRVQGWMV